MTQSHKVYCLIIWIRLSAASAGNGAQEVAHARNAMWPATLVVGVNVAKQTVSTHDLNRPMIPHQKEILMTRYTRRLCRGTKQV
jgi:hypothetical protein